MKIKKATLERIVKEEFLKHVRALMEGPDTVDAGEDIADKDKKAASKDKGNGPPKPQKAAPKQTPAATAETPIEDDEADQGLEADVNSDSDEDAAGITGSKLSKEIESKTVQSLTMQPKSKILPGAQEIEIQFSNSPDPLKILVTKTGTVKFFYKNALRNTL